MDVFERGCVAGVLMTVAAVVFILGVVVLRNSTLDEAEAKVRASYVCLEPDIKIPGRCLLAVHKPKTCWRFELAPNQDVPTPEYEHGDCILPAQ